MGKGRGEERSLWENFCTSAQFSSKREMCTRKIRFINFLKKKIQARDEVAQVNNSWLRGWCTGWAEVRAECH